jgi:UDP-2,3-diacylglucosamine hydrolase
MAKLFISDLHLCAQRPNLTGVFVRFLNERIGEGDELYILGDLFEAWLGDDAVLPEQRPAIDALRATTARGIPVSVMHGNRDFLLGPDFESLTGCRLIPDPAHLILDGTPTLLMHGDTLCTDDIDYQNYRAQVRSPAFIAKVRSMTLQERMAMADELRAESARRTDVKQAEIMDVNQQAVEQSMREHAISILIHGHTHRPAVHRFSLDGREVERIVLADWYRHGSVLVFENGGFHDETLGG